MLLSKELGDGRLRGAAAIAKVQQQNCASRVEMHALNLFISKSHGESEKGVMYGDLYIPSMPLVAM